MDRKTKGAWLLSHSKNLDAFTGASRLETIAYAGRVGRLYNLLRRNVVDDPNPTIDAKTVSRICQLNNIDLASRQIGLGLLKNAGRIDLARNGSVIVLGATSTAVLETTAEIFDEAGPSSGEEAVLELSEKVADRPIARSEAAEFIEDSFRISRADTSALIELCKTTAIIDEEADRGRTILFNSNTFRDGQYAKKALLVIEGLSASDKARLIEVQEMLARSGAMLDSDVEHVLGEGLYKRLLSVGLFDRMEVNNTSEHVGYICSPNDFQRYGRPFEDDPIDDAKALLASLTYGMTRSDYRRGNITMPDALLRALIAGREIGKNGVRAIGEDYKELERRQVVKVIPVGAERFRMKLLKKDVGQLALTVVRGGAISEEAILLDGGAATGFKGPHEVRNKVREKNTVTDKRFITDALDRLRGGD